MAVALRRLCGGSGRRSAAGESRALGVEANVSMLDPEQDRAILLEAGFSDVEQFFTAFTWRGWIAYA